MKAIYHETPYNYNLGNFGKTQFTYNPQGQVLTKIDGLNNVTTLNYKPNGLDVANVINANNTQTMVADYNGQHQPEIVTDLSSNGDTTFTYKSWGAPDIVVDPLGRGTRYVYGTSGADANRLVAVQNSDAPATANGPWNWVTVASFTYDNAGRVTSTTDAANLTMGYSYDLADRVTGVTYPDNTNEQTTYLDGLPAIFKDRAGRYSYTEYDALGNAKKSFTQDAANNTQVGTVLMNYDKNSNLILLTDTNNKNTGWEYDSRDRTKRKIYHDGASESYYYIAGFLSQTTGTRGQVIKYNYNYNGDVYLIDYPDPPYVNGPRTTDVTFEYNSLNDPVRITDGTGIHAFTYDSYGRMTANDGPLYRDTQTYVYDKLQRIDTQTVQQGGNSVHSQTYAYDALGRLASINSTGLSATGLTTYSYYGNSERLFELTHPNGTKTRQQFDSLGRLTHVFNGANGDPFYNRYASNYDTRDLKINTQSRTGSGSTPYLTTFYAYDALDQLKQERVVGGAPGTPYTTDYSYDGMGNRTQVSRANASGTVTSVSPANNLNQLTSVTTSSTYAPTTTANLTYDAAGNLTQSLNPANNTRTIYGYDDEDRLNRIEWFNGANQLTWKSEFVYDYASRRGLTKEYDYSNNSNPTPLIRAFVFDGLDVIQERGVANNFNAFTAQIDRDGGVSGILSRTTYQGSVFYGYDGNGNVTLLTDANGQDVGHYRYDAFGNTLEAVGPRAADNPYRFSTKAIHERSGLYDFGFRFYSPGMGRWLNRDPLEEEGGINLYAAMGNNPVNGVDEYGLILDVLVDVAFITYDVYTIVRDPRDATNWAALGADGLAAVVPFATGAGAAVRAGSAASKAGKATKAATKVKPKAAKTTYQTYTKTHPNGSIYVGRTSGKANPYRNVRARDAKHHMSAKGYGPALLDRSSTNRSAIRGREEQLIIENGGAQSRGGTSGNAIGGVRLNSPRRTKYLRAATKAFGKP